MLLVCMCVCELLLCILGNVHVLVKLLRDVTHILFDLVDDVRLIHDVQLTVGAEENPSSLVVF